MQCARAAVETARHAHTSGTLSHDDMFAAIREFRQASAALARLTSPQRDTSGLEAAPTHENHPETRPGA